MYAFLRHQLLPAFGLLVALSIATGVAYPAAVTAIAQVAFPAQANGSMIVVDGTTVGSTLIGQSFSDPKYLWGRPSAAGVTDENPGGYDANASAGSNLGPTNQDLIDRVTAAVDQYRLENGDAPVPVDLLTTSGSGLDPEISPAAADYQVARIAAARGIGEDVVRAAIGRHTEQPLFGLLGQPRVNVLLVNLDLDGRLG
jgi:potassium-transporting ATPase KdpC subunit